MTNEIYWLLKAYDAGHRKGWEPGPTVQETMDNLHAFLCNAGFDPNDRDTKALLHEHERTSRNRFEPTIVT